MWLAISVKVVYLKSCPFCQLSQFWLAMQSCSTAGFAARKSWASCRPAISWAIAIAAAAVLGLNRRSPLPLDVVRRRQWCPLTLSYCHFGRNVSIDFTSISGPFVPSPREEIQEMSKLFEEEKTNSRKFWHFGLGLRGGSGRGWCCY